MYIKLKARIRKDLRNQGIGVPIGNTHYNSELPLCCKWVNDTFMVYYNNQWLEAESIDWDIHKFIKKQFINP